MIAKESQGLTRPDPTSVAIASGLLVLVSAPGK